MILQKISKNVVLKVVTNEKEEALGAVLDIRRWCMGDLVLDVFLSF
jgi:hypothetical protein